MGVDVTANIGVGLIFTTEKEFYDFDDTLEEGLLSLSTISIEFQNNEDKNYFILSVNRLTKSYDVKRCQGKGVHLQDFEIFLTEKEIFELQEACKFFEVGYYEPIHYTSIEVF